METNQQLLERIEALEKILLLGTENTFKPTPFEYEREAPLVTNLRNAATVANPGSTSVVLTWEVPDDPRIEKFEIWARNLNSDSTQWVMKGSVTEPPWGDNLISDADLTTSFSVRTVLRNGLGTTIENSPTVPVSVTAPVDEINNASQIANGIVGDSKLDRSTDPISMQTADIANLAITNAKIANATIQSAKIADLAVNKLTAGTIAVAVTMTSPTITSTSGGSTTTLSGGNLTSTGPTYTTIIANGFIAVSAGSNSVNINSDSITHTSGGQTVTIGSGVGMVNVTGEYRVNGNSGQTNTFNSFPTQMVFEGGILTGFTP